MIDPAFHPPLDALKPALRLTKGEITERLITWFAAQTRDVQEGIMGFEGSKPVEARCVDVAPPSTTSENSQQTTTPAAKPLVLAGADSPSTTTAPTPPANTPATPPAPLVLREEPAAADALEPIRMPRYRKTGNTQRGKSTGMVTKKDEKKQ